MYRLNYIVGFKASDIFPFGRNRDGTVPITRSPVPAWMNQFEILMDGMNSWRVEADRGIRSRGRRKGSHIGPHRHRSGLRERRREKEPRCHLARDGAVLLKYRSVTEEPETSAYVRSRSRRKLRNVKPPKLGLDLRYINARISRRDICSSRVSIARGRHARASVAASNGIT